MQRATIRPAARTDEPLSFRSAAAGAAFVWRTKVILGALTLDMFAVLFGGATALLPIFSRDVLQAGPEGLGWLRAAPGMKVFSAGHDVGKLPVGLRQRGLRRGHPRAQGAALAGVPGGVTGRCAAASRLARGHDLHFRKR